MLLRYERQLKAETKARQAAEGAAAEALAAMGQPAQGKQQPHQLTADLQHQQEMLQQVSLTHTKGVFSVPVRAVRAGSPPGHPLVFDTTACQRAVHAALRGHLARQAPCKTRC